MPTPTRGTAPEGPVSRIKFRQSGETIDVLIDGVTLVTLWQRAAEEVEAREASGHDKADDLGMRAGDGSIDEVREPLFVSGLPADLGMWGPSPETVEYRTWEYEYIPEGFAPVLACGCGAFQDGGVYARVTFREDTVVWNDFHLIGNEQPAPVGPFIFDRQQYEEARWAFSDTAS